MSRIDDLLAELAPEGVSLTPLGELGVFVRGNGLQKTDLTDTGFPAIHYGQVHTHYGIWADRTKSFVAPELAVKFRHAHPGDLIIATTSEDDAAVAKATAWLGAGDVAVSGDAYIYRTDLDPRFVSYFFASARFQEQKARFVTGTKVRRISSDALSKIRIPVPPAEAQREIVRILDQFTQLEAELEAELKARRTQYDYYRHALLRQSNDAGVRDVALGDIIRLNFGTRITKKNDAGTLYPVYGGGGESFRTDSYNRKDEWVVSRFAMSANCVRRVVGQFWMLDSGFTFDVVDGSVDKDFMGQLLLSMQPIIFATSTQSAQKNIDVHGFKRLRVQVPSLDAQRRVSSELKAFDGIVNDLTVGLPAELAARRQQYEYYLNTLMTFREMAS